MDINSRLLQPGTVVTVAGNFQHIQGFFCADVSYNYEVITVFYDPNLDPLFHSSLGKRIVIESAKMVSHPKPSVLIVKASMQPSGNPNPQMGAHGGSYPQAPAQSFATQQAPPGFPPIRPISDLSFYTGETGWTILGRISRKSPLRHFTTKTGNEGSVFSFVITDAQGGEIQCKGFTDFSINFDRIENDQSYFISGGRIELAKRQFNSTSNEYEITLNRSTRLAPSSVEVPLVITMEPIQSIEAIADMEVNSMIDVVAVVRSKNERQNITSRAGKELVKLEVRVADNSGYEISVTFWGDMVPRVESEVKPGCVLALQRCRVSEYRGAKQLSLSGLMNVDPHTDRSSKIGPSIQSRAQQLQQWYMRGGSSAQFRSLSHDGAADGGSGGTSKCVPVATVVNEQTGQQQKEFFSVRGHLLKIPPRRLWYPGCPNCKRKVPEAPPIRCDQCQIDLPAPTYRYIARMQIADGTGSLYVTAFDQQATPVIGKSASELQASAGAEDERGRASMELIAQIDSALFQEKMWRCVAKREEYQGTVRIKHTLISAYPVNYKLAARELNEEIARYLESS
eukprot:gnl/Chilomastix_cuspidata/1304.p1 GENE.gnl/Chilomastix_cuspidata/1304~~gnl/Chilomastix_cuspidata/1304.p1  ORF type:complete len:574 (+),score=266.56 gnl/Chilomastix_cuspidata/1304:22-1722(+)